MSGHELDHVLRAPLPWRDTKAAECGLAHPQRAITRDEFVARVRQQGQKRAALTTCMTCFETAQRWPAWEHDPVARLSREFKHDVRWRPRQTEETVLARELRALAALVEAHRDEFDAYLAGLAHTPRLDEHRSRRKEKTR